MLFSFQRIRSTVDEKEQKQLLMDLEVVMKSNDCPYIVQFYGALFKEVRHPCCFARLYPISPSDDILNFFRAIVGFVWS